MENQMKLDLQRPRVRLIEDPPRRRVILQPDKEEVEYSPVFSTFSRPPWESGFYDLAYIEDTTTWMRSYYDHRLGTWTTEIWPFPTMLREELVWRGLAKKPEGEMK